MPWPEWQYDAPWPTSECNGPSCRAWGAGSTDTAGTQSLIPPTREIPHAGETVTVDGGRIEFQVTPGTEAPSEMNIYFPDLRALCLAENVAGTLHHLAVAGGGGSRCQGVGG